MHNFPFKSKNRDTVYHFAAKASNIEILKKATKRDLNQRDHEFRTPTHWAAFKGNLKALIVVLSKGGNPKKCDLFGNSSLHYAVRSGDLACVSYLINYNPKLIWILDNNYKTAYDIAILHQSKAIYELLDIVYNEQIRLKDFNMKKLYNKSVKEVKKRRKKFLKLLNRSKTLDDKQNLITRSILQTKSLKSQKSHSKSKIDEENLINNTIKI